MSEHVKSAEQNAADGFDQEIEAMSAIAAQLSALEPPARARVLSWAASRFAIGPLAGGASLSASTRPGEPTKSGQPKAAEENPDSFAHPAELFDAARPKTDADKALVLGYWLQACKGGPFFTSRQVNDELKHMGHGVGNITRALDSLMANRPAMVMQLEKSGKTQQAQKKFKVTHEGLKRVQQMFSAEN